MRKWRAVIAGFFMVLTGCSTQPPVTAPTEVVTESTVNWNLPMAGMEALPLEVPWQHKKFPGKKATEYTSHQLDGQHVVAAKAIASASMLRIKLEAATDHLHQLHFSWKVPALMDTADLSRRDQSDSPVRIVLAFDGDRSRFSNKNALISELAQVMTGEPIPYATLMYVWDNQQPVGTVIANARTDRVRKWVLESGRKNLNQWMHYTRDIRADFEAAFGEAPGNLIAIGIMTDSDNTQSTTQAWYGPVQLRLK